MSDPHQVKITGYELDMSGWMWEKATLILECIARTSETLRQADSLTEETRGELQSDLRPAAYNATKLAAVAIGAEWSPGDADVALSGAAGLKHILRSYRDGPSYAEDDARRHAQQIHEHARRMLEVLDTIERFFERGFSGRTETVNLLRQHEGEPLLDPLRALSEQATYGELDATGYAKAVAAELKELRDIFKEGLSADTAP